jgi:hypothetical protein
LLFGPGMSNLRVGVRLRIEKPVGENPQMANPDSADLLDLSDLRSPEECSIATRTVVLRLLPQGAQS